MYESPRMRGHDAGIPKGTDPGIISTVLAFHIFGVLTRQFGITTMGFLKKGTDVQCDM